MQCTDVEIVSDDTLEDVETYCLTLENTLSAVIIGLPETTCIEIGDNDNVSLSWQQSLYSTTEGSNIRICADLLGQIEISVAANITHPNTTGRHF